MERRPYFIGQDGHLIRSIDLSCVDDSAGIESAKQLDDHDLELGSAKRISTHLSGLVHRKLMPLVDKNRKCRRGRCMIVTVTFGS